MRKLIASAVTAAVISGCSLQLDEPENGVELAALTPLIADRFPDDHRILADGTWDAYTPLEKAEFTYRLRVEAMDGEPDEEDEALHRERIERLSRIADEHPNHFDYIARQTAEHEIFMLGTVEDGLRMQQDGLLGAVKVLAEMWLEVLF